MYTSSMSELDGLIDSYMIKKACYPSACGYLHFHLNKALQIVESKHPETFNKIMDSIKERTREAIEDLVREKGEKQCQQ